MGARINKSDNDKRSSDVISAIFKSVNKIRKFIDHFFWSLVKRIYMKLKSFKYNFIPWHHKFFEYLSSVYKFVVGYWKSPIMGQLLLMITLKNCI